MQYFLQKYGTREEKSGINVKKKSMFLSSGVSGVEFGLLNCS